VVIGPVAAGEMTPRDARMHSLFDPSVGRGLEIGPLHDPVVRRAQGDVRYVDVRDRAGLCAEYASHEGFPLDRIVEQDYVLLDAHGRVRPLREAVSSELPVDWVVASHVMEHVPDVVSWLSEVADVLVDGGPLVLAIPDRRFTFDIDRPCTTVGEMLLAHRSRDVRPSVRAVYDHFSRCMHIDAQRVWAGGHAGPRMYGVDVGLQQAARAQAGEYVDCHAWVWTAASFVEQVTELGDLDLCDFTVERIIDTARGEIEFYARLRRMPRDLDRDDRARLRSSGIRSWSDTEVGTVQADEPAPTVGGLRDDDAAVAASLSAYEARIVRAKRRLVYGVRSFGGGVRRRGGSAPGATG
jgi:SAM-dependent methyltransferase